MPRRPSRSSRRPSRIARWLVLWRTPVLLLVVMAAWWFVIRPLSDGQDWQRLDHDFTICGQGRSQSCVIDGDTLAIGFGANSRRIRLTGFDAPEIDGACPAEERAALAARAAVREWLLQKDIEWDGGDDPPRDQYGRELREMRRSLDEGKTEYLADFMIDRDLASANGWGAFPRDWCR
ncbi:MAG: hypothetical protein ABJP48_03635 [Erythrobacter sp.]